MLERGAHADLVAVGRVPHGVGRQLEQRLRQPLGVGHHERLCGAVEHPGPRPEGACLPEDVGDEPVDVDVLHVQEVRAPRLGERDEVVDQPAHAVELVQEQRPGLLDVRRPVGVHELEMPAEDGQRGAELVPRVVEELLLGAERGLEPVEHRVHRPRQLCHVVAAAHRDPGVEFGVRDAVGRAAEQPQGAQQPPGHQPLAERHHDQGQQRDHGEAARDARDLLLQRPELHGHHVGPDLRPAGHPHLDRDVADEPAAGLGLPHDGGRLGTQRGDAREERGFPFERERPRPGRHVRGPPVDEREEGLVVACRLRLERGTEQGPDVGGGAGSRRRAHVRLELPHIGDEAVVGLPEQGVTLDDHRRRARERHPRGGQREDGREDARPDAEHAPAPAARRPGPRVRRGRRPGRRARRSGVHGPAVGRARGRGGWRLEVADGHRPSDVGSGVGFHVPVGVPSWPPSYGSDATGGTGTVATSPR